MLGDSQSLTITGIIEILLICEPPKVQKDKEKTMKPENSLNHSKWGCKYHIVWIPKYRKKSIYKDLRKYLGDTLKDLAHQKECKIEEGHLMADHVHILISIPPKYSVAQVVGFIQGKSAISIAKNVHGAKKEYYRPTFLGTGLLCFNGRKR